MAIFNREDQRDLGAVQMVKQELINDVQNVLTRMIIKAKDFAIVKELKTFESVRLSSGTRQHSRLALVQIYRDLASLCYSLNSEKFANEIEWLNTRAKEIEKSDL